MRSTDTIETPINVALCGVVVMKVLFSSSMILGLVLAAPVSAVTVDQATFKKYGGRLDRVAESIREQGVFDTLRQFSYAKPWLAVGQIEVKKENLINNCTATWIGEETHWSYILTAAHCLPKMESTSKLMYVSFFGSSYVIAEGMGRAFVPPEYVGNENNQDIGAYADIAILRLPRLRTPRDDAGAPLEQPIIKDTPDRTEDGVTTMLVGYGQWGVGDDVRSDYLPKTGGRRLYGRNIGRLMPEYVPHHPDAILIPYDPVGPSRYWASPQRGDSGSALWQFQNGKPTIVRVAVRFTQWVIEGEDTNALAVRASARAGWIKGIFPGVRLLSRERPKGCIVLADTQNAALRRSFCLKPGEVSAKVPDWIYGKKVDVQADSGVTVTLSPMDNLSFNRVASFNGTVENLLLQNIKAANGQYLNFSMPRSIRVDSGSAKPLGCIVSLMSAETYCLPPGNVALRYLPDWIRKDDVLVQADSGAKVVLYDERNRGASFNGTVQNHDLMRVLSSRGEYIDLSQPTSIAVIKP